MPHKPKRPNLKTRIGLRDFLAEQVEQMARDPLEGQTAAAFAAITRQLVSLTRELEIEKAERKQAGASTHGDGGPDFAGMSEAEIRAYLAAYDGKSEQAANAAS